MNIWCSNAHRDMKLKIFWQVTIEKNDKMVTSTIVSKAS